MNTTEPSDSVATVIQESLIDEQPAPTEDNELRSTSVHETEEKNSINDDVPVQTSSTAVDTNGESKEATVVNHTDDEQRPKRSVHSRVKYSSMAYHRAPYYPNGHPYGPVPYYYYPHPMAPVSEKPPPLMFISTPTTSVGENPPLVSPQNLPPRLRHPSSTDNEQNSQQPAAAGTQPTSAKYGRSHRSILPRVPSHYYSPHPPPLMATPPGVVFSYPSAVHQPGHIAYNIRTPDELELFALQQRFISGPPPGAPLLWPPPPSAYPPFPPYLPYDSSPYLFNNSVMADSNSSALNPEAEEWLPGQNDNPILIDDEINFPPLNNNRPDEQHAEQKKQVEAAPNVDATNQTDIKTTVAVSSAPQSEPNTSNTSVNQDENKTIPASSSRSTSVTYSTVILQASDAAKPAKTDPTTHPYQRRSQQPPVLPKDRPAKQRATIPPAKESPASRRRPPPTSNRHHTAGSRNLPVVEPAKLPSPPVDDWIEVKSKKTKKFDRTSTDDPSSKSTSQEPIQKILSPPLSTSSLSSTAENTTATCTSEDEDEKDDLPNAHDSGLMMIVENPSAGADRDYNQEIIDDIRRRLDRREHLLIILRGCPGSGKSTLAKALNDGYHGQIFSTDEYFKDAKSNEYIFDSLELDEAHRNTYRLVSDAFKQQISPIIIDNTNTTAWEMKTYVSMGQEATYEILLVEPQTPWRYKARELVKRNLHNLPVRRVKEMLNRFEHNATVQSILEQMKNDLNLTVPATLSQPMLAERRVNQESLVDTSIPSRKHYDLIDDPSLLNDVRLCINDMILFLTSNFYQTSQSSTSLSLSFSDLSLIPSSSSSTAATNSLPNTPSTPHSLFHRSLSRFSSTTGNPEHSFSTEHLLRLPAASFSRCADHSTASASANATLLGKKRRKNKPKQQLSNESLLNTNNSNNRCYSTADDPHSSTYRVLLPADCSEFLVIDDSTANVDCDRQRNSSWDHSSTIPHQKPTSTADKCGLLNIIRNELTTPSASSDEPPSNTRQHIAIQCSAEDFNQFVTSTDQVLIGRLVAQSQVSAPVSPASGYTDCGVQVDVNSDAELIQLYSDRLHVDLIKQCYDLCQGDIQWTRAQLDDYLQQEHTPVTIPTLRQLSFNALSRWDTQIKDLNPSFDTISIGDLLQDINDEGTFEELINDDEDLPSPQPVQFTETKEVFIPWPLINSVQELYGDVANLSSFASSANGISMPLDDELMMNIYQALQRFVGISHVHPGRTKPVNEKKTASKENKKVNHQQWKLPTQTPPKGNASHQSSGPSLKAIMDEELNYINTQKPNQKPQLDFASQHKLKELERQFPLFGPDVLYEIFRENEFDYDLSLVCISSMLDENAAIVTVPKPAVAPLSMPPVRSPATSRSTNEVDSASYDVFRRTAQNHALKRKDCYQKADQANRQGMTGVASYYINQAREQTQLMKDANRRACEQLSQKRLTQFRQTHRLDLHELYADEALSLFQRVEQELYEGNRRTTALSIEVITGYGKGSVYGGGCGKIRTTILAYLRQKKYKYSELNKGAILVQLTNA